MLVAREILATAARKNLEKEADAMSFIYDPIAARHRHEEMLREAEQTRLARMAAKASGAEPLLSRMVKLLSRSSRPTQSSGRSEGTLSQQPLTQVKIG
jgi:hypothetical protein